MPSDAGTMKPPNQLLLMQTKLGQSVSGQSGTRLLRLSSSQYSERWPQRNVNQLDQTSGCCDLVDALAISTPARMVCSWQH